MPKALNAPRLPLQKRNRHTTSLAFRPFVRSGLGTPHISENSENRFHEEINTFRSNLSDFRTNLGKLGISWVIRLLISVFLLIGLYYLYFI